MKYKELKRQIQNLNIAYEKQLKIFTNDQALEIYDDLYIYVTIRNDIPYCMQVREDNFESLEDNLRYDLLKVSYEFAQTPIDSRKLFPKFYISSKLTPDHYGSFLFKFNEDIDHLAWGTKFGKGTKFTEKEIDYIRDKFNTKLNDFNIVEVEE